MTSMATATKYTFAAGIVVAALGAYLWYRERCFRLPTAEEQAWLDQQLCTPKPQVLIPNVQVSEEEQKWLDKQIEDSETADVRTGMPDVHVSPSVLQLLRLTSCPQHLHCSAWMMHGKQHMLQERAHQCADAWPCTAHRCLGWSLSLAYALVRSPTPKRSQRSDCNEVFIIWCMLSCKESST